MTVNSSTTSELSPFVWGAAADRFDGHWHAAGDKFQESYTPSDHNNAQQHITSRITASRLTFLCRPVKIHTAAPHSLLSTLLRFILDERLFFLRWCTPSILSRDVSGLPVQHREACRPQSFTRRPTSTIFFNNELRDAAATDKTWRARLFSRCRRTCVLFLILCFLGSDWRLTFSFAFNVCWLLLPTVNDSYNALMFSV